MVLSIINGTSPADIPIQSPDGILIINMKSAARIPVKIPEGVLRRPDVLKVD